MSELMRFARPAKITIARGIAARLEARMKSGPPEPPLDAFIDESKAVIMNLETHVDGGASVDGSRAALLATSDESDDIVDTWLRKLHGFIGAEALRRTGPNREHAKKLHDAAFPKGLTIIDERTTEENAQCRATIEVLRAPENEGTLAAIGLPVGWIDAFEAAVEKSDADYDALATARVGKSSHVSLGRNAELEWEDMTLRLRHYIAGRAKRNEIEKIEEGQSLLAPLTDALTQMRALAAMRATLRSKKAAGGAQAKPQGAQAKPQGAQANTQAAPANGEGAPANGEGAIREAKGDSVKSPPVVVGSGS